VEGLFSAAVLSTLLAAKRSEGILLLLTSFCCSCWVGDGSKPLLNERSISEALPQELCRCARDARLTLALLRSAESSCKSGSVLPGSSSTPALDLLLFCAGLEASRLPLLEGVSNALTTCSWMAVVGCCGTANAPD
jgi:hypothetical protein